jgi:flagellar hook-associated protein 1 FlgK
MSLTSVLTTAQAALATTTTQSSVVSRNIAGINDTTYSRKTANVSTTSFGSTYVSSITRAANQALFRNMLSATSDAAAQQAVSNGLDQLQQTVGQTSDEQSPAALIGNLQDALQTYSATPSDSNAAAAVVTSAQALTSALNSASRTVQEVRSQADSDMASAVGSINSLLTQFQSVNQTIVTGTRTGADVTNDLDTRDSILSQLSQYMGITTVTGSDNSTSIYTDSGVTLFNTTPRSVTFAPTSAYTAPTVGNAVYVDGVPVTGSSAVMPLQSGSLAGLANLRDTVAVTYQSQLDEVARGLIDTYAESDQTGGTQPTVPGLFTYSGAPSMPAAGVNAGLAADITVNANVDPNQGGDVTLLRDGGISDPGNPAYTYNTTGAAAFTGRIDQLDQALTQTSLSFDPATGIDPTDSVSGFATASVSWLEAARQNTSNQLDYKNAVVSQSTTALSSATGVNLDDEMSNMLDLEHSYEASAKLMSTVESMFTSLFQALQ